MRRLVLIVLSTTFACGTEVVQHLNSDGASREDARVTDFRDSHSPGALDGGAPRDATSSRDADFREDAAAGIDAGPADVPVGRDSGPDGGPPAQEIASRQTVTVVLTNTSTIEIWVPSSAWNCDLFSVQDSRGSVPIGLGFQCICECPMPPPSYVQSYALLAPGASYTMTWDARRLVTWTEEVECPRGPGAPVTETEYHGVLQPVAADTYLMTVGYADSIPADCSRSQDVLTCNAGFPDGIFPMPIRVMCPLMRSASLTFTLPQMGDVRVELALP
jgi:hypothetical protein